MTTMPDAKIKTDPGRLETPMILLLFAVMAACTVLTLVSSARLYANTVESDAALIASRTAVQFLETKIRNADRQGSVHVHGMDGTPSKTGPVLSLSETTEDTDFRTDLYVYDGSLYEIFTIAGIEIDPECGEEIMDLQDAYFEKTPNGIVIHVTSDGIERKSFIALRTGQEGLD